MILLAHGNGVQNKNWKVQETKPAGFCRVYYITNGSVFYNFEHDEMPLECNTLYLFPSVKGYSIHHNPDSPLNCLWFHIDLFPTVVSELIAIPVTKDTSFYHLLEALKLYFLESGGKGVSYFSLVSALITYCYDHEWLHLPTGKITEILDFINTNYMQSLTIEEISQHFNYTPEHFIRMFQKRINLTPYQYLIHRRMSEASSLLLQDVSVKDVAQLVGYQDAKVFAHRFKQIFLISPSQYKKFNKPLA